MNRKYKFLIASALFLIVVWVVRDVNQISKKEYAELIKNHPLQDRLKLSRKERKDFGVPPNRYFDDEYLLEMDPKTGRTHPENLLKIRKQKLVSQRFSLVPGQSSEMAWQERGPDNFGGRTRVVFYDPNDVSGKRVFAGGVSGGLWVNNDIENINSRWTQVGVDENLAVSCYAIDPNNSNIWYIGTGEVYTGFSGVGNGIWRTLNGGNTWEPFFEIDTTKNLDNRPYFINQILAWNDSGTTNIYAAIDARRDVSTSVALGFELSGWWSITENSSQKIEVLTDQNTPYVFSDVEVAVDNSIWIGTRNNYRGHGGGKIFRSVDGIHFTEKYSFTNGRRVELTVSKQNKNTVYALAEIQLPVRLESGKDSYVELVKTTNGIDFELIARPDDVDVGIDADDFARNQARYNLTLEVNPTNDQVLYAGGIDLFQSINGGDSWKQISKWINARGLQNLNVSLVHADQHVMVFNPMDNNKAIFGNDGGIYYSSNLQRVTTSPIAIESRNKGYNIAQFYSGAIGVHNESEIILGGTQDNGSLLSFENGEGINSFERIHLGDGVQNFVDKEGEYIIVSGTYNTYGAYKMPYKSTRDLISIDRDRASGYFANIADLDDHLDILYTNGFKRGKLEIARYKNLLNSPIRKNFSSPVFSENPTVIKVSPFTINSSTVFIGTVGASILKVTNFDTENPIWENIDINSDINVGAISDIDFGVNEDEILVTLHNYGVTNIYYTVDGGLNWQEKEGDYPDIPVKAIKMNPLDKNEVIIGTNLGVWKTANFMSEAPNWVQSQNGMSNVKVTKLDIRTSDNTVIASTYGRGLFTGKFEKTITAASALEEKVDLNFMSLEKNRLEFKIKGIESPINVIVVDMKGSTVLKKTLNPQEGNIQGVDITFQSGIYIVHVSANGKAYSKKIIVSN